MDLAHEIFKIQNIVLEEYQREFSRSCTIGMGKVYGEFGHDYMDFPVFNEAKKEIAEIRYDFMSETAFVINQID